MNAALIAPAEARLPAALLLYSLLWLATAFAWRSWRTWRATGINPLVLPAGDSAEAWVGRAFKLLLLALPLLCAAATAWPTLLPRLGPLPGLQHPWVQATGAVLLAGSWLLVLRAQVDLGAAWRIGIDRTNATPLVRHGVYRYSRNPIFLGMRLALAGLFACWPNAATLALLLCGEVLMQVQVRLEEAFLRQQHGAAHAAYCAEVHRWL